MLSALSSRVRYWLLQGALCLILVATLGLAVVVREYRLRPRVVELDPPEQIGDYRLARPSGWIDRNWAEGIVLEEGADATQVRRRIEIAHTRNAGLISPLQYLLACGELSEEELAHLVALATTQSQRRFFQSIQIGPWPGILVRRLPQPQVSPTRQPMKQQGQLLACTVLPSGHAIVLRFWRAGYPEPADEQLFIAVAQSLRLDAQPELFAGPELQWGDGVRVEVPKGLVTFAVQDVLRVSRTLVDTEAPGWLAVDLVPCTVLAHDPGPEMLGMLMLRDAAWSVDDFRQIDESTWVCQRRSDSPFPAWAYLRIGGDGRAMLAEFRGGLPGSAAMQARVEALWERLSLGIAFSGQGNVRERVKRGAAALRQGPADPAALLERVEPIQIWEWYSEDLPKTSAMKVQYGSNEAEVWGIVSSQDGPPLGSSVEQLSRWRLARDGGAYDHLLTHTGSTRFSQECRVAKGMIHLATRRTPGMAFQSAGEVPEGFVPGGILPLALGRLPSEPMILHTEAMLAPGELPAVVPLRLLMEPASDLPKHLPDHPQPMRCWSIRLNGASDATRWYLDDAGQLHSVTYPAGTHLHRRESNVNSPASMTQPASRP